MIQQMTRIIHASFTPLKPDDFLAGAAAFVVVAII
jgi:hypothetical protein